MGRGLVFSLLEEDFPLVFYAKMVFQVLRLFLKKQRLAADFSLNAFKTKSSDIV